MAEEKGDFGGFEGYRDAETGAFVSAEEIAAAIRGTGDHFRPTASPFPGTAAFELSDDLDLGEFVLDGRPIGLWGGKRMHRGPYITLAPSHPDTERATAMGQDGTPVVFTFGLPDETVKALADKAREAIGQGRAEKVTTDDGRDVYHIAGHMEPGETFSFKAELRTVPAENGKVLTLNDVFVWAAARDAEAAGNMALARAVLVVTYSRYALQEPDDLPKQDDGAKAELPRQDTKRPTNHFQMLSKVSSDSILKVNDGETVRVDVSGRGEAPIYTVLSLTYEGDDVSISKPMTAYDQSVHNAIATLWEAGNRFVTTAQIFQVMSGARGKPSPTSLDNVEKSTDKQRFTAAKIDYSAELRGRTVVLDGEPFTIDQCRPETYVLNADKIPMRSTKGNRVVGYRLNRAPIFYEHDTVIGQITSYPQALLEATARTVSSTPTNITLRDYLIGRISRMKNPHSKTARNIVYDTAFKHIGRGGASPKDRRRMIETARSILNTLAKEGFIEGWDEYKETGSSHRTKGVTIKVKTTKVTK